MKQTKGKGSLDSFRRSDFWHSTMASSTVPRWSLRGWFRAQLSTFQLIEKDLQPVQFLFFLTLSLSLFFSSLSLSLPVSLKLSVAMEESPLTGARVVCIAPDPRRRLFSSSLRSLRVFLVLCCSSVDYFQCHHSSILAHRNWWYMYIGTR